MRSKLTVGYVYITKAPKLVIMMSAEAENESVIGAEERDEK